MATSNKYTHYRIDEQINTQKNSEYSEPLNHWLHKLEESGARDRMWMNWTYKATEEFWVEDNIVLGFQEITLAFLWVLGGIVFSLIISLGEKAAYMVRQRQTENRRVKREQGWII